MGARERLLPRRLELRPTNGSLREREAPNGSRHWPGAPLVPAPCEGHVDPPIVDDPDAPVRSTRWSALPSFLDADGAAGVLPGFPIAATSIPALASARSEVAP